MRKIWNMIIILVVVSMLSGCVAAGLLLTEAPTGTTSKGQPTERLNYFNYGDRQECLDRGLTWKSDSQGRKVCVPE